MQNSHEGHLKVTRGLAEQPDTGPGGGGGFAHPHKWSCRGGARAIGGFNSFIEN